jgi:O-antigen ligase
MQKIAFGFLLLLIFTIPLERMDSMAIPGIGSLTRLIGFGTIAISIIYILVKKKTSEPPFVLWVMILFVVWSLLTYFWSINPAATVGRFVTNIQLLAMVWLLWELCKHKGEILTVFQVYIIGAYVAMSDMLISYFAGYADYYRISVQGGDPNWMTNYLAFGIPLAWYLIQRRKNDLLFIVNMVYIPLMVFCSILTASRGGMLTTLTALSIIPFSLVLLDRRKRIPVIVALIIIVVVGIIKFPQYAESLERNIERLTGTAQAIRDQDLSGRQDIYKEGLRKFSENSIAGIGAAGFRFAMEEHFGWRRASHNGYLSLGVETGLIGLLIFLGIFVVTFLPSFNYVGIERIFFIVMTLTILIALVPTNMEANKTVWLMLTFMILHSAYLYRDGRFVLVRRL